MLCLETALLVATLSILIWFHIRRKWSVLKAWGIPHDPPSIFRFGHQTLLFGSNDVSGYYIECRKKYGSVWGYYVGTEPRIVVHDTNMLKQIMIKDAHSTFPNRADVTTMPVENIFASGLIFSTGKQWKRMRSTLTPAFSSSRLRGMSSIIEKCIGSTMQNIAGQVTSDNEIKVIDIFAKFSLDAICATAFGTHGVVGSSVTRVADLLDNEPPKASHLVLLRLFPMFRNAILSIFASRRDKYIQYLTAFCRRVAKERDESTLPSPRDLMQLMLESRVDGIDEGTSKGLTQHEVAANSITMLLAGRNTLAHSLNYLAYNLAMHAEVQEKLRKEIDHYFAEHESLDWEVVSKMKYLEMCIVESMRLYPPFARTIRKAERDIMVGDTMVSKGTCVDVPIHALSRDPELWKSPLEFDPERFRDMSEVDTMVYQPFGNGPRVCIGKRFALLGMKLFVSRLLHEYVLLPSESTSTVPLDLTYNLTVTPKCPVMLRIHQRRSDLNR